ncbi:MAG: DNA repair protein RadC [Candidatus Margulisiibacteriota bacterium]
MQYLPPSERPRERLKELGAEALSVQELLALIMGKGQRGESVMITAQRLLNTFGGIEGISRASLEELDGIPGIGSAKASQLIAAFELIRRRELALIPGQGIKTAHDAAVLLMPQLKNKKKEHFIIVCLDTARKVIKTSNISVGTLDTNLVHPREVFNEAIQALSSSIMLVHNHPSGNTEPSMDDIKVTRKLHKAGKLLGINVLDHIIIAGNKYLSFKEEGIVF